MQFQREDIQKLAQLARLGLREEQLDIFTGQLSSILSYVAQLSEVDTEGTAMTSQVTGLSNILQEDQVQENHLASPEDLLNCSPFPKERHQIRIKRLL